MGVLEFFVPSNRKNKDGTPAPLDGLNELIDAERGGWGSGKKKRNGRNAERHCLEAMEEVGWVCPNVRSVVTLTFVEPHGKRDPDNIYGGAKFILDGITKRRNKREYGAGAIEDDSQKWIVLRFGDIAIDKQHPGCLVRIETEEG